MRPIDRGKYCGVIDPNRTRWGACCVLLAGHEKPKHRDLAGKEWNDPPEGNTKPDAK